MNLIHKEFLIALANGEEVEYQFTYEDGAWRLIEPYRPVSAFDHPDLEFRIKPKTVTLSMEIPMPFVPEINDRYWWFCAGEKSGVGAHTNKFDSLDKRLIARGVYRTEEEAIQALAAHEAAIAMLLEGAK